MKRILFAGLCLAVAALPGFGQGLLLNPGAVYTYEFTNFAFQAEGAIGPNAEVGLTISSLTPADSFEFSAYENNLAQVPLVTTNFGAASGLPVFPLGAAWQDFQGVFRIRMLSGSMILLDFYGAVITPTGDYYSEKPLAIPEPSAGMLLGGGLLVAALAHQRRRLQRAQLDACALRA